MHYAFTLDPQEIVSFAQHPGGSDCECPQDRCFLKQNVFRSDLKEERLGAQHGGLGREFQVTDPMLVEFDAWNSHETSVCGTQRVHWKVNHSHWTL